MSVSAMLTLAPGCYTVAAPSGSGGAPAAVTDGGGAADVRRASIRRYVRLSGIALGGRSPQITE